MPRRRNKDRKAGRPKGYSALKKKLDRYAKQMGVPPMRYRDGWAGPNEEIVTP